MIIFSGLDDKKQTESRPCPYIVKNFKYKASVFPSFYKVQRNAGGLRVKTRETLLREPMRTRRRQSSLFVLSSYQEFFKLKSRSNLDRF